LAGLSKSAVKITAKSQNGRKRSIPALIYAQFRTIYTILGIAGAWQATRPAGLLGSLFDFNLEGFRLALMGAVTDHVGWMYQFDCSRLDTAVFAGERLDDVAKFYFEEIYNHY
jgi:hypothetical protein